MDDEERKEDMGDMRGTLIENVHCTYNKPNLI